MEIGIIGLPNVGKSTLFNALTSLNVLVENFPFTTIEPNIGIVPLPDDRLKKLGEIFKPQKLTSTTVKFIDIAGLVKDASHGAGLGNKFLSYIREVDALIQVVRVFEDDRIANTLGSNCKPQDEIGIIETELILADLEQATRAKEKLQKQSKSGDKKTQNQFVLLENVIELLNKNVSLRFAFQLHAVLSYDKTRHGGFQPKDLHLEDIAEYNFLTLKPILYIFNVNEKSDTKLIEEITDFVKFNKKSGLLALNAQIEYELSRLEPDEREKFEGELNIISQLKPLITQSYTLLNLITFYTVVGGTEVRAWSIPQGTDIKSAGGKIHSDMEAGFIRAEVYSFDELIQYGSEKSLRDKGIVRIVGKDYIVVDGDIIQIRFQ